MIGELTGFVTGLTGLALAAFGVLLAFFAGLRLLFLIRKPGKGRIARGIAVSGVVLLLCGAVVLAEEELLDVSRHMTDQAVWVQTGLAVVLALFFGIRAGRRRPARELPPPEEPSAAPTEPVGPPAQDA